MKKFDREYCLRSFERLLAVDSTTGQYEEIQTLIASMLDELFANSISREDREQLATLIYYPEEKMDLLRPQITDMDDWYRVTLHRLIALCRLVSERYTRSKVRLPAEGQVQLFPVTVPREADPVLQHAVLRLSDMGGAGAQHHFAHELRVLDRKHQRDHAALGGAEQADLLQPQRAKSLGRIARHLPHRIGRRELPAPVEYVNGICILERAVGIGDGVRRTHDALHAQPRKNDKGSVPVTETKIVHGKVFGMYGLDQHKASEPPFAI